MSKNNRLLQVLSIASPLCVLAMVFYLANLLESFEGIEDRLHYQEPALQLQAAAAASESVRGQDKYYSYVPSYSHVYTGGGKALLLETTLTVRNTDPEAPLTIHSVAYYDSRGKMLREYVSSPLLLPAMATAKYLSELSDVDGGAGANFLVTWSSPRKEANPIFEAVMIGADDSQHISFTSRGQRLDYGVAE
ncbi:hypothetical protein SIN8267_00027 [Sinobacterium norvegicum]|uniref:DUF3124 domain-containing protein n=1 Tax=Sinobacterium norvegicum TaxID=1641715 RepID=A0ABM9A9S7_9GAMM|nr:DUF3124 domain-containing protein [Sinobacterium norvegicum]CAH0989955.1 hypothetical protein SIN8267_00027 [Sinobacterium norvegicum]